MYRIRLHGRGGQGLKTASRILGSSFFHEGYEVQDAPRYGAERRGAPIFAYVRADKKTIHERGVIINPDLVIVADDSLVTVPAAGVLQGLDDHAVMLINSHESADTWQQRLNTKATVLVLPVKQPVEDRSELPYIGATCVGAAARLIGVIPEDALSQAIDDELADFPEERKQANRLHAFEAYKMMESHEHCIKQRPAISAVDYTIPEFVSIPFEDARVSAPTIHSGLTSVEVKTGLWRTMRPVIEYDRCHHCWWICSSSCPDNAINIEDNRPVVDYDHCKGCMICVAQCPSHAITAIPETEASEQAGETK
jgi:pyruvate ferredoxin oxidoreductase gamma subunit